jgi:hypothetical protein
VPDARSEFYKNSMEHIRSVWSRSGWYRLGMILALVFVTVRLAGQVYYLFIASPLEMGSFRGVFVPNDLKDYLEAAQRFSLRENLYLIGKLDKVEFYQYSPAYALSLTPLLSIHPTLIVILDSLLHIAAYVALYFAWRRIFMHLDLPRGAEMMIWTLPLWLLFEPFWSDLSYLNIYIFVALVATWLTEAVLRGQLGWSVLWTVVLLQTKPFWAFAVGVPLLMGNRKFFWKLLAGTVLGYLAIAGVTILAGGYEYSLSQYSEYFQFLSQMSANFPWRGADLPYLGYNHSVMQVVVYFAGISSKTLLAAKILKYVILLPLVGLGIWNIWKGKIASDTHKLEWAFALYLGAFIYLDIIWEVSLGLAVFAYILAVTENRTEKILASLVFIPYCLLDFWRLLSFAIWGYDSLSGAYIITDPSTYIPMILFVLLVFYVILLRRLFARAAASRAGNGGQALGPA